MDGQRDSVDAKQSDKQPLPVCPNRWNRVSSWKVLLPSLILGLLLLFIALGVPTYQRFRALQRLGEHKSVYSLRDEEDWLRGPFVALGRVEMVVFEELTDESLSNIAMLNEVTHLRGIVADAPPIVTQEGIDSLKSLSHLQDLYLVGTGFSDDLLADWFSARPPLRSVEIKRTDAGDRAMHELSHIPSLARLDLFSKTLTDNDFDALKAFSGLQELNLNGPLLGDHSAEWLSKSSDLQSLHLKTPMLTDRGVEFISRLPDLRNLLIWECPHVTDAGIAQLELMAHLELLLIPAHVVTPESVDVMSRMPALKHVHICGSIENKDLRARLHQLFDVLLFEDGEPSP